MTDTETRSPQARDPIVKMADDALALSASLNAPITESWSEEKLEAEGVRASRLMVRALQTPATTLEGVLAKLRIAHRIETYKPELDNVEPNLGPLDTAAIFWAIRRDLERLAGREGTVMSESLLNVVDQLSIARERTWCLYLAIENGAHESNEYTQAAIAGLAGHLHELISNAESALESAASATAPEPEPSADVLPFK